METLTKEEKAKIIEESITMSRTGIGFSCKDWQKWGYTALPWFETKFEAQLSLAHQLRYYNGR